MWQHFYIHQQTVLSVYPKAGRWTLWTTLDGGKSHERLRDHFPNLAVGRFEWESQKMLW